MTDESFHSDAVRGKLVRILGPSKGVSLFEEVLAELSLLRVSSAEDVLAIASRLQKRGGLLATVGTSLAIHAELHGASRP